MAVAIVTGAGRGIGRATAVALAQRGYSVGLIARSAAELDETRALIQRAGGTAVAAPADVTDSEAVARAVTALVGEDDGVSVLVNNAASLRAIGPLWEVDPDDWWADVHTSLGGAFNLCRAVVPGMIERGSGRVVNVVSYAGTRPAPYQTAYGCAKAALANLTESLAVSLAPHGVQAFAVAPGYTDTAMTRELGESESGRAWLPEAGSGRVVDAERSAELIATLASGGADALNGRLVHALDEVDELLAQIEEIRSDDLYVARVRRLPGS
jgi:NAD(P)-dependent dehydrogenase (short-subunit alcohol dehydrogenase family)